MASRPAGKSIRSKPASNSKSDATIAGLGFPVEPTRQLHELVTIRRSQLTTPRKRGTTTRAADVRGTIALFTGARATRTRAAEAVARELDLPLMRVDLAKVVSKTIGETEKNLSTVFDAAGQSGAILFFDEADALFGKRTEVKDAHDRYANAEIGDLIEPFERFDGLAVVAARRRTDLDDAFLRRLRFVVEIPPIPRPK